MLEPRRQYSSAFLKENTNKKKSEAEGVTAACQSFMVSYNYQTGGRWNLLAGNVRVSIITAEYFPKHTRVLYFSFVTLLADDNDDNFYVPQLQRQQGLYFTQASMRQAFNSKFICFKYFIF